MPTIRVQSSDIQPMGIPASELSPYQETEQPNSVAGGALRRFGSTLEGAWGLFAPKHEDESAFESLPPVRLIKGYGQSLNQATGQAKKYFQEGADLPPGNALLKFLDYARGGTTALAGLNPFTSSSAANINDLSDQGRKKEAAGQGGLDAALLALGIKGPREVVTEAAKYPVEKTVAGGKIAIQELAGAGKEPVARAARAAQTTDQIAQARYEERLAAARDRQAQIDKDNPERIAKSVEERTKLATAKKDYVQKEFEARKGDTERSNVEARKQVLARGKKEYAKLALDNLKRAKVATKARLDARWNSLRAKMDIPGAGLDMKPVQSTPIVDAIEKARSEYLVGSPEDLKSFNDLIGQIEKGPLVDTPQGPRAAPQNLGWQEARTHYTNIGDRMYGWNGPSNVYKAMQEVHNALDRQLQEAANARGLGNEYRSVKSDWSQYKSDFDDMRNMATGGGSPLARMVRFSTPEDAEGLMSRRYGDRLFEQAARYEKSGASPKILRSYRDLSRRQEALESPKGPAHPKRVTGTVEEPALKPPVKQPKAPQPTTIDPALVRLQRLESYAGEPFSFRDIFNPVRWVGRPLLKFDAVRRAVAAQPRNEIVP
jgi:hypothetical protein